MRTAGNSNKTDVLRPRTAGNSDKNHILHLRTAGNSNKTAVLRPRTASNGVKNQFLHLRTAGNSNKTDVLRPRTAGNGVKNQFLYMRTAGNSNKTDVLRPRTEGNDTIILFQLGNNIAINPSTLTVPSAPSSLVFLALFRGSTTKGWEGYPFGGQSERVHLVQVSTGYNKRWKYIKSLFLPLPRGNTAKGGERGLGEPTLEVRAEDKLAYTMPYEEEESSLRGQMPKGQRGGMGQQLYHCLKLSVTMLPFSIFLV